MLKNFFISAGLVILTMNGSFAMQKDALIKTEEFISPEMKNYDCHSSSLMQTSDGKIHAVWKAGLGQGKSNLDFDANVGIWQSHFDGKEWSEAEIIHFEEQSVIWNPVLAQLPSGESILFYRVGAEPWASVAFLKRSSDNGEHWSEAELLPAGIVGPSKNKPLFLEDGTMLCPSSMQTGSAVMSRKATAVWIDISKDGAKTWVKSGPLTIEGQPFGAIEPALFLDADGNIRMLCRDRALREGNRDGHIWTSVSSDKGKTWSALEKTNLPNPDSAFDTIDLGQGKIVLIYNHSQTARHPLSLAVSSDGGKSWDKKMDLEETGEFPAAILATDGMIHMIYAYEIESGQRRIKHLTVDPKPLFQNDTTSTIR